MTPLAADRSVRIECSCGQPALAAYADRQRFSQILVNLVSNAVKYNMIGGRSRSRAVRSARSRPA